MIQDFKWLSTLVYILQAKSIFLRLITYFTLHFLSFFIPRTKKMYQCLNDSALNISKVIPFRIEHPVHIFSHPESYPDAPYSVYHHLRNKSNLLSFSKKAKSYIFLPSIAIFITNFSNYFEFHKIDMIQ